MDKNIIVAMTYNKVIGINNSIPWFIPEELKLFKNITINNVVIMGKKTFESIGKPLPNRVNIVVSKSLTKEINDVIVCDSISSAIEVANTFKKSIFFIGGGQIYKQILQIIDYIYISYIKENFIGDTFFPDIDFSSFEKIEEKNYKDFIYIKYKRKKNYNFI